VHEGRWAGVGEKLLGDALTSADIRFSSIFVLHFLSLLSM
jgi:hypothetical protein